MKLKEDSQLCDILKEFSAAIKKFGNRNYKDAGIDFDSVVKKYKDSEFYSVLEVQTKAKSYKNICNLKTSKKKLSPETEDDILNELLFCINTNKLSETENIMKKINEKKINSAYYLYLKAIHSFKQDEEETALDLLKKAVTKDKKYKITAYNEPDLLDFHENEKFLAIIE